MGQCFTTPVEVAQSRGGQGVVGGKRIQYALNATQGRRPYMEDTVLTSFGPKTGVLADTFVCGVFDGHGGARVAEFCRESMVEFLSSELRQTEVVTVDEMDNELLEGTICDTFLALDDKIGALPPILVRPEAALPCLPKGEEYMRDIEGVGSTATMVLVTPDKLVFANCGDSRTLLVRGGSVVFETTDHTPDDVGERERIEHAGGYVEANRVDGILGVARALGDHRFKTNEALPPEQQEVSAAPEVTVLDRSKDDQFIVLASDGLWNVMTSQDVADFLSNAVGPGGMDLEKCCAALIERACNQLRTGDNTSVAIVALSSADVAAEAAAQGASAPEVAEPAAA